MTSDRFVIRTWLREKGFGQQQERGHTVSLHLAPNPAHNDNDVILEHKTVYTDLSKSPEPWRTTTERYQITASLLEALIKKHGDKLS